MEKFYNHGPNTRRILYDRLSCMVASSKYFCIIFFFFHPYLFLMSLKGHQENQKVKVKASHRGSGGLESHYILGTADKRQSLSLSFRCLIIP